MNDGPACDRAPDSCWWRRTLAFAKRAVRIVYEVKQSPAVQDWALKYFSWTTANQVTVFRGLLTFPVIALLVAEKYWAVLLTGAFEKFLDALDGILAKAMNDETELGKHLDPLMDKLFVCGMLVTLAAMGKLHDFAKWTSYGVFFVAGALTLARFLKWLLLRGPQAPDSGSGLAGKWKLVTEAFALFFMVLGLALRNVTVLLIGECLLAIAVTLAIRSFFDQMATARAAAGKPS